MGVGEAIYSPVQLTHLFEDWAGGGHQALDRLTPLVCDELRRLAAAFLRRQNTVRPDLRTAQAWLSHRLSGAAR